MQGIYTGAHPDYTECNGMNLLNKEILDEKLAVSASEFDAFSSRI